MTFRTVTSALILSMMIGTVYGQKWGQYPPFTRWHQNPLGFHPVNLHTSAGLILPAVATGAILLLTRNQPLGNRWRTFGEGGYSRGYFGNYTDVFHANSGVLYSLRRFLDVGAEASVYRVHDEVNNTWGFGLRPFARFYAVRQRLSIYFESGAGLIYFLDPFPRSNGFLGDYRVGTRLNGSPKYGVGLEYKLADRFELGLAFRHIHVSNGNNSAGGKSRNPGHDSNGVFISVTYSRKNKESATHD